MVFDATENKKVSAVSAKIEYIPADRWRLTMKTCKRSGKIYAAGICFMN